MPLSGTAAELLRAAGIDADAIAHALRDHLRTATAQSVDGAR
jgi:hypothetical protein